MPISRRRALTGLTAIPFSIGIGSALAQVAEPEKPSPLLGSWEVTSAVNSVVLSIEPGGEALMLLMENGSFSMARSTWKAMPGGVLIEGLPRFRLWAANDRTRVRVEMDTPEGAEVSGGWQEFPQAFFMSRIERRQLPKAWRDRPMRAGWEKPVVADDWDQKAGQRRKKIGAPKTPDAPPRQ